MAAGTVGYEDTRGSRDYLGMIASEIKNRVTEASDMANEERQYAEKQAEEGGTSLDEAGIGRGYFFGKALGSRFGGDAIARTRGRFAKTPTAGIDPKGNAASRFRGGFDYNVTNKIITDDSGSNESALSNSVVTGFRGVQTGLTQVAKALIKIDNTLSGLEKSQMNMARAIMFQGYMMAMLRSEQQRAAGRDSLRREESSIEGGGGGQIGGQSFGGAGGGRGMININDPSGGGGAAGGLGALTSFGSSQLLGKNTKTIKGIKKGVTAAAKRSPKAANLVSKIAPNLLPGAGKVTQSLPLLPAAAKTTGKTISKFSASGAAKSLTRITGRSIPKALSFAKEVGKNSKSLAKTAVTTLNPTNLPKTLKTIATAGRNAITKKLVKPVAKIVDLADVDDALFARGLYDDAGRMAGLGADDIDLNRMSPDELMANAEKQMDAIRGVGGKKGELLADLRVNYGGRVRNTEEAMKLYGDMVSGKVSQGITFSQKEADQFLKSMMDKSDYAKFAKDAYKPMKTAAKTTVAEGVAKSADDVAEAALKTGAKTAGKAGGKALFRSIMKKIPIIAGVAGIAFGIQRALEGDLIGAGLEITSGILGATGVGGSAGLAIDGFLLGRDLGMMNKGGDVHSGIGGMIPGGGVNKDTIPTMLTTGEFIMNRNAVDQIGSDTLNFMNNSPGQFGYSSLLGGTGSDLDLEAISTNVEDMSASINALSQQIVSIGGSGDSIINNVVNNYGSGGKPGEGGGESSGGDFSDSGLDSFRMHYLGSLM